MGLKAILAAFGGDVWRSWRSVALWPYPALVYSLPRTGFTWLDYRKFCSLLKPGDFLLTRSDQYFLSNWAISGTFFKHLAVYTGGVIGHLDPGTRFIESPTGLSVDYAHTGKGTLRLHERTVTHAISEGVVCQDLGELLFHSDWVCAVRPWSTKAQQEEIVAMALKQVGKSYDFDFKLKRDKFYCTELGVYCARIAGITAPTLTRINTSLFGLLLPLKRFRTEVALADNFIRKYPMVCASGSCGERVVEIAEKR